jgi:hypothetical protein
MHFRARGILSVQLYWPELSGKFSQNFSKIFPEIFFRRAGQFRKGGGSLPTPPPIIFPEGGLPPAPRSAGKRHHTKTYNINQTRDHIKSDEYNQTGD